MCKTSVSKSAFCGHEIRSTVSCAEGNQACDVLELSTERLGYCEGCVAAFDETRKMIMMRTKKKKSQARLEKADIEYPLTAQTSTSTEDQTSNEQDGGKMIKRWYSVRNALSWNTRKLNEEAEKKRSSSQV